VTWHELKEAPFLILVTLGEAVEPFEEVYRPKEKSRWIVAVRDVPAFCHFHASVMCDRPFNNEANSNNLYYIRDGYFTALLMIILLVLTIIFVFHFHGRHHPFFLLDIHGFGLSTQ